MIGGLSDCCTMLEMADAYATLANGGTHVPTTVISKVVFPDGKVVNLGNPPHNRVFSDGEAYEGTQVLKTVIQSGTGTAANYGCPAAGKTGTAENLDNAWFVGYTPKLSTAVWVGYPQGNIEMANGFGGTLAAPIWHDFMLTASRRLLRRLPAADRPVRRDGVHRPAFIGQGAAAAQDPARTDRTAPVEQPDALRPANHADDHHADRWRDRPGRRAIGRWRRKRRGPRWRPRPPPRLSRRAARNRSP